MQIYQESLSAFILSAIALIFHSIITFFINYILVNLLTSYNYAYFSLSFNLYYLFLLISTFGMEPVIIRLLSNKLNDFEGLENTISNCFHWILMFTSITTIFLLFSSDFFETLYKMPGLGLVLRYLSFFLFFTNFIGFFEIILRGLNKFSLYTFSNIATNIFKLIIVLMNFFGILSISTIIGLFALLSMIQFIIILLYMNFKYNILAHFSFQNYFLTMDILKSASIAFLSLLFLYISQYFNVFILAYYIPKSEFSIYNVTLNFIQVISISIFIFDIIILPIVSKYFQEEGKKQESISYFFQIIFKISLLFMIPITILIYFIGENIIYIFFPLEYLPSALYLKHYLIYLNISGIGVVGANFLYATNQSKIVFKLIALSSIAVLILSFILIPIYYVYGAIYAIIIPNSIYLITTVIIVKKKIILD